MNPAPSSPENESNLSGLGRVLLETGGAKPSTGPWVPPTASELSKLLPAYEIEKMLGRGGMGSVYLGRQLSIDRQVAIKILSTSLEDADPSFAERFKNEARAMGKLNHPGIVAVHDFGEAAGGLLYIAMEYVDGTDVSRMIAKKGRLHTEDAMAITAHVCDALAYAHDCGIIHRDIKPANIMVSQDGVVKVADFGLAKMTHSQNTGLTQSGMAMGTLHYMAPEALMLGSAVDHRADIYAVGVMLYQMLTGKLPQGMFRLPSLQIPGLDPRYDGIITKALMEEREARLALARQILLPKAQNAMKAGDFPLNALYAAVALGFRGFGYESLTEAEKALVDSKYPPVFDPAEQPGLHEEFLSIIQGETRSFLPVWTVVCGSPVNSVKWSPDSQLIALGGDDRSVRLIDAASGKEKEALAGHEKEVLSVAFSPDSKTLASGSWDTTVRLWDLPTWTMKHKLEGHQRGVTGLAFNPEGLILASSGRDNFVRLWGKERRSFMVESRTSDVSGQNISSHSQTDLFCLAMTPDGRQLATGSHQTPLCVTNWQSSKTRVLLEGDGGYTRVYCVAFSPDGKLLASGGEDGRAKEANVRLWDVASGALLTTLRGHKETVRCLAFHPDGTGLASGGDDNVVFLWDVSKNVKQASLTGHVGPVHGLDFSPCGNALVSASKDGAVKVWDIAPTKELMTVRDISSQRGLGKLSFSPDGTQLATGDGFVKLNVPATAAAAPAAPGSTPGSTSVPTNDQIAAAWREVVSGDIRRTGSTLSELQLCYESALSPDGALFASFGVMQDANVPKGGNARDHAQIQIWEVASGKIIREFQISSAVSQLLFSKDSKSLIVIGPEGDLSWLDLSNGSTIRTSRPPFKSRAFSAASGNGSLLAGTTGNREILLWDLEKDQAFKTISTGSRGPSWLAMDHDAKMIAVCLTLPKPKDDGRRDSIVLFDVASGQMIEDLGGRTRGVVDMAFSRDGSLLASRSSGEAGNERICEVFSTRSARLDLASYFLRNWYSLDAEKLDIAPAIPTSSGSLNFSKECRYLRALPANPFADSF